VLPDERTGARSCRLFREKGRFNDHRTSTNVRSAGALAVQREDPQRREPPTSSVNDFDFTQHPRRPLIVDPSPALRTKELRARGRTSS
jgi:hypothetical protein